MAYTTINKSTDYFNTVLYTGNDGTGRSITGVGFQPDFVWVKDRSNAFDHGFFDTIRGATKALNSNDNSAEDTISNSLTAFGSDGFTAGANAIINGNNNNYVSWNWKAGGSNNGNTNGTIYSTTSVNDTAGFSMVIWTGTGSAGTLGHGLSTAPKMVIVKRREQAGGYWRVYHSALNSNNKNLKLNATNAEATDSSIWNDTSPTNTVFSVGSSTDVNAQYGTYVAYCFAEKQGYSKFGSYVGNGSDNGTFIYTGFKPAFVMFKNTAAAGDWTIQDSARDTFNLADARLYANLSNAENDGTLGVDFLSNGIKIRTSSAGWNTSAQTYIYMAFAAAPLVGTNNVPCTAR